MNKKRNIKQFVLTNGQEIVCDVIEWAEEDFAEIVVRNCMEIVWVHNNDQRIYMFKPWMHYQETHEDLIIINSDHIISTAEPMEYLVYQYDVAVKDMNESGDFRKVEYSHERKKKYQRLADYLMELSKKDEIGNSDSDKPSNIIPFPPLIH
jgi:hypothetical protein